MSALATMVNATFRDRNLASDAIYRPGGVGLGVTVRVTRRSPDRATPFGDGRFVTDTHLIDVRVSEVAALGPGDTFQIGAEIYGVRGEPLRDAERLVWSAEARLL